MEIRTDDVLDAVRILKTPKNFSIPTIPAPKSIATTLKKATEKNTGVSVLVSMYYTSLSGNDKERDILIRRVVRNKNDWYIDGVAMDIRAPRLIKVSQIKKIIDVGSGRTYDNPYLFLQNKMGIEINNDILPDEPSDFSKAIARTNHEITVLMYLVAIDGVRNKKERHSVLDYVKSRTSDLNYDEDELNEYLISVAPDEESFINALHKVLNKDKQTIEAFIKGMLQVITADNTIHERERAFLIRIINLLEHDGFEITLPL